MNLANPLALLTIRTSTIASDPRQGGARGPRSNQYLSEQRIIIGYKAFDNDLTCAGFHHETGRHTRSTPTSSKNGIVGCCTMRLRRIAARLSPDRCNCSPRFTPDRAVAHARIRCSTSCADQIGRSIRAECLCRLTRTRVARRPFAPGAENVGEVSERRPLTVTRSHPGADADPQIARPTSPAQRRCIARCARCGLPWFGQVVTGTDDAAGVRCCRTPSALSPGDRAAVYA